MSAPRPRTVGLVPHPERPAAAAMAVEAARSLAAAGVEVRVAKDDAARAPELAPWACDAELFAPGLDVVVSLGGDGTMLRVLDLVSPHGAAVLGVNVGHLGYLTEVEPHELGTALDRLVRGDYTVEERMALDVRIGVDPSAAVRWWALNELVIEKAASGSVVRLDVDLNGVFFTTYVADGLIVASPTGSTAYSFSARGPIVSPRHRCLLVTPVSPHMLFDRSLVLDDSEVVRVRLAGPREAVAALDGREVAVLRPGDVVTCTAGREPARVVSFAPRDFHQILKAKFGLADR